VTTTSTDGARVPGYGDADRARWVAEPSKRAGRDDFARDRARLLHSSALRRLGGKTQVVGPGSDDFARTRLTHSLEVAQVGRELATALGCSPDVVDTACLAHDLGHPPFGHNGESALDTVMDGHGGFEGNAQTLRLLTRLEPKVEHPDGSRGVGLNLTRASLDATTKYPWRRGDNPSGAAKFGVYDDDLEVFTWLREGTPDRVRCVEAQVMDLADDVAYSVHDVEDAVVGGWLDPAGLDDPGVVRDVAAVVREVYLAGTTDDEVVGALDRLRAGTAWVGGFDGGRRSLAAWKNLTSQLVGRFSGAAEHATRERYGTGPLTRYAADVVVPHATVVEIAVLKGVAALFVMAHDLRGAEYERQREVLAGLVAALVDRDGADLEPPFAADHRAAVAAGDEGLALRAVVDQVASLTDARAVGWAASLGVAAAVGATT
jgi:dGTPase